MVSRTRPTAASVRTLLEQVTDPEIPVLTIDDIGILRDVVVDAEGHVTVTITPTYSGCPAMEVIAADVRRVLADGGYDASVEMVFNPPWTTAWMNAEAKRKLAGFGIAPPGSAVDVVAEVLCPNCTSSQTNVIAEFSSTACKRMLVCTTCGEPFDQFKEI